MRCRSFEALSLGFLCCIAGFAATPTFHADVAAILDAHCVTCHRPDGAAPFSLIDYGEVQKRGRNIAEVLDDGTMPPWLPAKTDVPLAHPRVLPADQETTLLRWLNDGMPRGAGDRPEPPRFSDGWQLGPPDLVVTSAVPVLVPADGPDVFRNVVLRVPAERLKRARWVRAVELRPGSPRLVHHAIMKVDRSGSARVLDAHDAAPGFPGMEMGGARSPAGHFVGWTPGKEPDPGADGLGWELRPGDDLVVQLHLPPTGKPGAVRPQVGFYFSDTPPVRQPFGLLLFERAIDLPAGAQDVVVSDHLVLPVAVEALAVYPHAHYLADEIRVRAGERDLLHIPAWDFNWQDDYRFAKPVKLPAGTRLSMQISYDNSADNPRNPNHPPRRVTYGTDTTNEMAAVFLQVVPQDAAGLPALEEAVVRRRLEKDEADWAAWSALGELLVRRDPEQASQHFEQALELNPDYAAPHYHLGLLAQKAGRVADAVAHFERAVALRPEDAAALGNLATLYYGTGKKDAAIAGFRQALAVNPGLAGLHSNLGSALCERGELVEGIRSFQRCIALDPDHVQAHTNLVRALKLTKDPGLEAARVRAVSVAKKAKAAAALRWLESVK